MVFVSALTPRGLRFIATAFAVVLLFSIVFGVTAEYRAAATQEPKISLQRQAECLASGDAATSRNPRTGALRFVGTAPGRAISHPRPQEAVRSPEAAARAYLSVCGSLLGMQDEARELQVTQSTEVEGVRNVVRLQQFRQGVPVLGGELIVHLDRSNNILAIVGKTLTNPNVSLVSAINAAAAAETALTTVTKTYSVNREALSVSNPEPWIYDPALVGRTGGVPVLVWRVEVTPRDALPIRELVFVDAQRGSVVLHFNQVETILNRQTYTLSNGTSLPGTLVCSDPAPCNSADAHVAAAHLYAGDTYNYYLTNHGRDGIDGSGMTIKSSVHYGNNVKNAYWDGSQMVYGDAYGYPLADDVVGHELTHGVTQYSSRLFAIYQSGAINESLSDIFGEFVDLTNGHGNDNASVRWLIGEDVAGQVAIRNMQNPPAFGQPDKMTSPLYDRSADDNGAVHVNDGINNKAAYLMVDGGTFNGQTITGLGITKVAKIYYEVQTHFLTSGADYADLYDALYQACNNLVGTAGITAPDCQQVRNATLAVEMNLQPAAAFNPDAPVCSAGAPSNVFFDDLESGAANFLSATQVGTSHWSYDSPYPPYAHSGLHFLYGDDYPDTITDTSVVMASGVTLPSNAFLRFAHAFGFQLPTFDGGVVEYSTNGGATWTDAGSLFDVNGYIGTITSGFGNPLAGRSGFVGDSHGYISSRLNLSSLAGRNVRFRWRMGLDSTEYYLGWWLDDVRIYTCPSTVPAPVVMGITPSAAVGGITIAATITGSNLGGATAITFGGTGVRATPGAGGTATSVPLTITVDSSAPAGLRPVTVTTAAGVSNAFSGLTVYPPLTPLITIISPNHGSKGATVAATLTGFNLSGATAVTFSGSGVRATIASGGTSTNVPVSISIDTSAPPGLRDVAVTTPSGTSPLFGGFTVDAGPAVTGMTPASGNAQSQTLTFTFTDTKGFADLGVVNVLINNYLDGRNACYIAFVPSGVASGSVYLVNDAGDAAGPYEGMVLPGNSIVQNSQCLITGALSSVTGDGNTLTLNLRVTSKQPFGGNRVIYMAAQDVTFVNTGWQAMGVWNVPGGTPPAGPAVSNMNPARSTAAGDTFTFRFTDTNGFADLSVINILVNNFIDGRQACYMAIVPSGPAGGSVFLVDDAGNAGGPFAGGVVLPGSGSAANSQCIIDTAGSAITGTGNTRTVTMAMTFKHGFAGNRVFYAAARNNTGGNSDWQAIGTVTVP